MVLGARKRALSLHASDLDGLRFLAAAAEVAEWQDCLADDHLHPQSIVSQSMALRPPSWL